MIPTAPHQYDGTISDRLYRRKWAWWLLQEEGTKNCMQKTNPNLHSGVNIWTIFDLRKILNCSKHMHGICGVEWSELSSSGYDIRRSSLTAAGRKYLDEKHTMNDICLRCCKELTKSNWFFSSNEKMVIYWMIFVSCQFSIISSKSSVTVHMV